MTKDTNKKLNGTVKWFSNEKGYGFLTGDDGNDVFVHYSDILGDGYKFLTTDEQVTFRLSNDDRKKAIEVEVIEE